MNVTKLFLFQRKGSLATINAEQKKNRGRKFGGKLREADSVFLNSMDLPVCLEILFNCLRNAKKKIKKIYEMQEETLGSQIKGELQLIDLNKKKKLHTIYGG